MSHIVTVQTRVHDPIAVMAACRRLSLAPPIEGTARLFSGEASGILVNLPGWQYPLVIDTLTGVVRYDNFERHWGDSCQLEKFLQRYAVEKTRLEAQKKGYQFTEQQLQDGSIKIQLHEGSLP